MEDVLLAPGDMAPDAIRAEMRHLLRRVPPGYQGWDHSRTVDYKAVAKKAGRQVEQISGVTHQALRESLTLLRGFW